MALVAEVAAAGVLLLFRGLVVVAVAMAQVAVADTLPPERAPKASLSSLTLLSPAMLM